VSQRDAMTENRRRYTLLGENSSLVLRALALEGPAAVDAFRSWRAKVPLDDAGGAATRVLPVLVELMQREAIDDPDLQRMRGVGRHIWTQNTLNVRLLLAGLDALAEAGIRPMLLKGMALFVRSPDFMRKRQSTDSDVLVSPDQLEQAAAALARHGFEPRGFRWEDFSAPLIGSETSGATLRKPDQRSHLDLHWRPLSSITDPALAETFLARAETHILQGRPVLLPTVTDQLFMALARAEPWDEEECLKRLVEAHMLLSSLAATVNWDTLAGMIATYRLEALALAFLGDLDRHAGLGLPGGYLSGLEAAVTAEGWREFELRRIRPAQRTLRQDWRLRQTDERSGRDRGPTGVPGHGEIQLRGLGLNAATAGPLWQALRRRVRPGQLADVQFLEGFSYPEAEGRWTSGQWSALAVPLTAEQRAGEPVRLNVHALGLGASRLRIAATGGRETLSHVRAPADPTLRLELRVRPLPELDGGGLILLWTPDARTPRSMGLSTDERRLGLFFRHPWSLPGHRPQTGATALYRVLRQAYRHLPLPMAVRSRLSPALGMVQQQMTSRTVPAPLPIEAIKPGDVVISAFLSDQSGIARAGRLTRDSLRTWGVKVIEHDITADPLAETVPEVGPGGVWICHCNPPEAIPVLVEETARLWASRYRIGVWAYELERLPPGWLPMLAHFHEIWAPSQFVADAIRRSSGSKGPVIRVVPHPMPLPETARPLATPHSPFNFLTMFDARSTAARKNPMGAIKAFQLAFEPGSKVASLLIKASFGDHDDRALLDLHEMIAGWPNISVMTEHLSDAETLGLIAGADCLVSLHRSEGFGLPIAEAMTVGTPTIITDWSAPVEFTDGAAIAIPYDLVPVTDATGRYAGGPGLTWADARLDDAAQQMRALATNSDRWQALSAAGLEVARASLCRPLPSAAYGRYLFR
jgi:glycosyltransferase involved in cell wall biosynthesis